MPFKPGLLALLVLLCTLPLRAGEALYNGITLPDKWPPRPETFHRERPETPPYLVNPPEVIPIDVGRQLFVDDFLIQQTTLKREFHRPDYHPACPILKPESAWEFHGERNIPFAAPFSDGVWFDPADKRFKMWYLGGTGVFFCYATSGDGIHWQRPELDTFRKGSNILKIEPVQRDSSTVWLDLEEKDPRRRFKLLYYRAGLITRFSPDGIHWSEPVVRHTSGDRTTFFYNPFRQVYVYSVRSGQRGVGRCRLYAETKDMSRPAWSSLNELSRWACADKLDRVRDVEYVDERPDLYNLDAAPYESLMLGLFTIHAKVAEGDRPKLNYVTTGFSRDGFHWHRPDRRPFLDVSDDKQAWNYGNVQSAGGGCLVVGDKLYFYCSGRNSRKPKDDGSGGSTGLAILRRDGFASVNAADEPGTLTTRPLRFSGKHLFVNVDCPEGSLRVEVLDEAGQTIAPFTRENANPVQSDSTRKRVTWKNADELSQLSGKTVRFRFHLTNGSLYAFWVSPDAGGASHGYVAAGGPEFNSHRDIAAAADD